MKAKIRKILLKWLNGYPSEEGIDHYYTVRIEIRKDAVRNAEQERLLQEELHRLREKYPDTPMFWCHNVDASYVKEAGCPLLYIADPDARYVLTDSVFTSK